MQIKRTKSPVAAILAASWTLMMWSDCAVASEPTQERQAELLHLLKQDCGSCHGMTLKGGLGPALLSDQLSTKEIAVLKQIILVGRPSLGMPPWKNLLSEEDAEWLAKQLVNGVE